MRDHSEELLEKHTTELIDRYFLGALPPSELDALRVGLRRAGIRLDTIEQMRLLWQKPSHDELDGTLWTERMVKHLQLDATASLSHVQEDRLATGETSKLSTVASKFAGADRPTFFSSSRAWLYAVGGVTVAVLLSFAGWQVGVQHTNSSYAEHTSVYTTGNGQRAKLTLADGSVVMLNVASRLEVPTDYVAGNRTVRLVGEALFTVAPRSGTPFIVNAGPSAAKVLGTSFVVRRYLTDTSTIVAVRDGKVSVGSVVLVADQEVVVGAAEPPHVETTDARRFSFSNGILTLADMPLSDAIPELNRWYDTEIRLGDATLATQRVYGVYRAGSISDLASILELTFNVRVVREGRVLTLYSQGS